MIRFDTARRQLVGDQKIAKLNNEVAELKLRLKVRESSLDSKTAECEESFAKEMVLRGEKDDLEAEHADIEQQQLELSTLQDDLEHMHQKDGHVQHLLSSFQTARVCMNIAQLEQSLQDGLGVLPRNDPR